MKFCATNYCAHYSNHFTLAHSLQVHVKQPSKLRSHIYVPWHSCPQPVGWIRLDYTLKVYWINLGKH